MTSDDILDHLADLLAARVAARIEARISAPPTPELATSKHNPLGNARAFLDAAKESKFPSGRRGREVVARWEDVVAYDRSRVRPRTSTVSDAAREAQLRAHGAL